MSSRSPARVLQWPSLAGSRQAVVWLLMGNRRLGDNNQLRALAEALGYPFEAKVLSFNQLRRLPFISATIRIVARRSRSLIKPPWPDLVIGVGYASVPVARYIRQQSGGRAKLVHVGNPRGSLEDFDLQITTPQYTRASAANLIELPFPIGNPAREVQPTRDELRWLDRFPHPRRLVAVGGPARHWQLDHGALARAIRVIQEKQPVGSLIIATSPRTSRSTRRLVEQLAVGDHQVVIGDFPRFGTLLRESDEIYVTADSVSMLSEAILTGKPVGMIPIARSLRGRFSHILWEAPFGRATLPNFANFWKLLARDGLVGTVELPVASQVCDTVERAAAAVRSLVAPGDAVDEQKPKRGPGVGAARRSGRRQQSGAGSRRSVGSSVRDEGTGV